jgi:hypothetical protein
MAWSTHSTTEDFYITLRYADNIAQGAGFVYNHGERVLGTTTPLYTLLLAFSAWLHLNAVVVGKLLNIAADGITCFLIAYITTLPAIRHPRVGQFAAVIYAFSSTPISITIGGMETGLVTCVCIAMITAYTARIATSLYLLGALLFLLRIDGLVLFGLLAVVLAVQQRRLPWRDIGLAVLIIAPWVVFATVYFGSPIPTSLTAKLYVYSHAMATPRAVTIEAFRTQFTGGFSQIALSLLFLVGVVGVVFKRLWVRRSTEHLPHPGPLLTARTSLGEGAMPVPSSASIAPSLSLRAAMLAPIAWVCVYYFTMFSSRVPPFPWYFLPPWPIYLIVAMIGARLIIWFVPFGVVRGSAAFAMPAAYAGMLALGLFGMKHFAQIQSAIEQDQYVEDTLRTPLGLWFNSHAMPTERIMLEPIGYVGYFSQRPILDMIGLVSPEVFRSYRTEHALADMVQRFHPDWLCIRPAERESILSGNNSLLNTGYVYVREFHAPGRKPDFLIYHARKASTVE